VSDPSDLLQTLLITSARLVAIRKSIGDGGHIQAMVDIDTLVAVAKLRGRPWDSKRQQPAVSRR
jgi:hypothetical protein